MRASPDRANTRNMTPAPATRFEAFTVEHFLLIAAFLVVCVALVALGRAHRGTAGEVRFRRAYALLIPCFTVPMQVLQLVPSEFDFAKSLPLQLCDFAWIAAVVALWTRHWAGYVVVEIALVAAIWALLTLPWTRTAAPLGADAPAGRSGATQ